MLREWQVCPSGTYLLGIFRHITIHFHELLLRKNLKSAPKYITFSFPSAGSSACLANLFSLCVHYLLKNGTNSLLNKYRDSEYCVYRSENLRLNIYSFDSAS